MKKRILAFSAAVLLAVLCIWRLWPHSLQGILDTDGASFGAITVQVSEFGVDNGSPNIDVYRLDLPSPEDENHAAFMSILQGTKYRQDFRNLLPWDIRTVGSGSKNITHSAYIMLTWGEADNICYISFHGDNIISFDSGGNTEYRIYHPTDRTALNRIAAFIKANGELQA